MRIYTHDLNSSNTDMESTTIKREFISIDLIQPNKGQIPGVPKNPRFIRDERYAALKKSITDFPGGLQYKELFVYPLTKGKKTIYVTLAGNMRLRACKELGYETMPCKIVPPDADEAFMRRLLILDNESFGQNDWDIIANEFNPDELADFGMELDWLGVNSADLPTDNPTPKDNNAEESPANGPKAPNFAVQMVFNTMDDRDRFVAAYKDVLQADYNCVMNVY